MLERGLKWFSFRVGEEGFCVRLWSFIISKTFSYVCDILQLGLTMGIWWQSLDSLEVLKSPKIHFIPFRVLVSSSDLSHSMTLPMSLNLVCRKLQYRGAWMLTSQVWLIRFHMIYGDLPVYKMCISISLRWTRYLLYPFLIISAYLYRVQPRDEGMISRVRLSLVSQDSVPTTMSGLWVSRRR